MEIEILKQKETPLLSRKRISAYAYYTGPTPSRAEIKKAVASKIKAKEDLLVIRHIYTRFGQEKAKLIIHLYSDAATMVRLEGQALVDKHKPKAGKNEEKPEQDDKDKKQEAKEDSGSKTEDKEEAPEEKPEPDKKEKEDKEEKKPEEKTEEKKD